MSKKFKTFDDVLEEIEKLKKEHPLPSEELRLNCLRNKVEEVELQSLRRRFVLDWRVD